jgi:hypothetical protein
MYPHHRQTLIVHYPISFKHLINNFTPHHFLILLFYAKFSLRPILLFNLSLPNLENIILNKKPIVNK